MGGTDTQVENPSHRLHQTKATTTGHVMKNCFCLGFVLILDYVAMLPGFLLNSRVIQQVVGFFFENTACELLSRYMILPTIQQQ